MALEMASAMMLARALAMVLKLALAMALAMALSMALAMALSMVLAMSLAMALAMASAMAVAMAIAAIYHSGISYMLEEIFGDLCRRLSRRPVGDRSATQSSRALFEKVYSYIRTYCT